MSTDDTTARQLDGSATVGQQAQPALAPAHIVAGYKTVRSQVLVWCGILGGVLTVFSNIGKVLTLSDWARWWVTHWHDWTHAVWTLIFSWFKIQAPEVLAPILTFSMFMILMSIGVALGASRSAANSRPTVRHVQHPIWAFIAGGVALVATEFVLFNVRPKFVYVATYEVVTRLGVSGHQAIFVGYQLLFHIIVSLIPLGTIALVSKEKLKAISSYLLGYLLCVVLVIVPLSRLALNLDPDFVDGSQSIWISVVFRDLLLLLFLLAMIIFTPINALMKRLSFIAIGLVILLGLNEISRHDLSFLLQAPK